MNETLDHTDTPEVVQTAPPQTFEYALSQVKLGGAKISRAGWNGKDQFVFYQKGYPDGIAINRNTSEATGLLEGTKCFFQPYLMIRNAQNQFIPWLASQGDLLANDWIVEAL